MKTNQKHLNLDSQVIIEKGLNVSKPLSAIAAELRKNLSTIAKEIKKHRAFQEHNKFNEPAFRCASAKYCHHKNVIGIKTYRITRISDLSINCFRLSCISCFSLYSSFNKIKIHFLSFKISIDS